MKERERERENIAKRDGARPLPFRTLQERRGEGGGENCVRERERDRKVKRGKPRWKERKGQF